MVLHRSFKWIAQLLGWGGLVLVVSGVIFGFLGDQKRKRLKWESSEWKRLTEMEAPPIESQLKVLESRLQGESDGIEERMELIAGRRFELTIDPPISAESLFFDLVATGDRLRALCDQAEVECKETEYFGFGAFVASRQIDLPDGLTENESRKWLYAVARQRALIEGVLGLLIGSSPREIVAVERMGGPFQPADGLDSGANERWVLRNTMRLVFEGKTETLRCFMLSLIDTDFPVIIRQLEVSPSDGGTSDANGNRRIGQTNTGQGSGRLDQSDPNAVAIVQANASRFELILATYGGDWRTDGSDE